MKTYVKTHLPSSGVLVNHTRSENEALKLMMKRELEIYTLLGTKSAAKEYATIREKESGTDLLPTGWPTCKNS